MAGANKKKRMKTKKRGGKGIKKGGIQKKNGGRGEMSAGLKVVLCDGRSDRIRGDPLTTMGPFLKTESYLGANTDPLCSPRRELRGL